MAEVAQEHFSRVPVYRRSPDNIVGILHAKDLAARRLDPSPPRVERLVRPPYFIPPGKMLADLFDEMRRGRFQIALVVNEYGRLLGLVTLEDLLEELFGEIHDEFDVEVPELRKFPTMNGPPRARSDSANWPTRSRRPAWSKCTARENARQPDLAPSRARAASGREGELGEFEATIERVRGAAVELREVEAMSVVGLIVALLACLAVQAFFAASEIAMVSADDLKVRAESEGGHQRSRVLNAIAGQSRPPARAHS